MAVWLAIDKQADILEYVAYAWAGLGATFGPVMLLSLYWPLMNRVGAVAGMLAGDYGCGLAADGRWLV